MASAYNLEPQTNAKVVLKTTHGDLDIELWAVQTPLTSRNFLQLCLDGYYTNTIFHRLVPDFILQGGDPTGTGHGGEAIYDGGLFADEFHSRLRFNRRGLVGMANSGRKNDNGSQFFLTLGDTKELTGRNTMFGMIVGDTLYNLVRMGQGECEEGTERPVYPVKILGVEVLINPFEGMKPREVIKKTETLEDVVKAKKTTTKKKGGKTLLSFGDEEGDGSAAPVSKKPKFNTRLVVAAPLDDTNTLVEQKNISTPKSSQTGSKYLITTTETVPSTTNKDSLDDAPEPEPEPTKTKATNASSRSPSSSPEPLNKPSSSLAQTNTQIAALKASLRARSIVEDTPAVTKKSKKSLLSIQKEMLPPTSIKGRKRKRGKAREADADDGDAAEALKRFQNKLSSANHLSAEDKPIADPAPADPASSSREQQNESILDEDPDSKLCDLHFIPGCASCGLYDHAGRSPSPDASDKLWSHTLSFEKDRLGKDLTWKKKNEELSVIDPREKEKEILGGRKGRRKEGAKAVFRKGFGGAGGGSSGREWDRGREGVGGPSGSGSGSGSRGRGGRGGRNQ